MPPKPQYRADPADVIKMCRGLDDSPHVCDLGSKVGVKASATWASGLAAHACAAVPAREAAWSQRPEGAMACGSRVRRAFGPDAVGTGCPMSAGRPGDAHRLRQGHACWLACRCGVRSR